MTNFGWDLPAGVSMSDCEQDEEIFFFPAYRIGEQWHRFQSRGRDVAFASEHQACAYLRGIAGETRVERGAMSEEELVAFRTACFAAI